MKTVVGLLDDFAAADEACSSLRSAGFAREDIGLMASEQAWDTSHVDSAEGTTLRTRVGAGTGAAAGGLGGLLVGVGALAIPGFGPIVAAGPILATLTGAGVGAAAGGILGALTAEGIPRDHAEHYAEGVRRGGTLVMVRAPDELAQSAADILESEGAVDIEERADLWRQRGYAGYDANAPELAADEIDRDRAGSFPVVEEQLEVGKRSIETGRVHVYTHVVEEPVEQQISLQDERVVVERQAVDRPASSADLGAFQDQTLEIVEHGERAVVQKTARVVEEVTVGMQVDEHVETVRDTVKKTQVDVQRTGAERTTGRWSANLADFRSDYDRRYAASGASWEDYEPAYRYGMGLSDDPRYSARDWDAFERDARTDWEAQRPGTWERMKDAIRFGWQKTRARGARYEARHP